MKTHMYIFLTLISTLIVVGCKSKCNCTGMDTNKAQQIEQQDHYIPWWIKSK